MGESTWQVRVGICRRRRDSSLSSRITLLAVDHKATQVELKQSGRRMFLIQKSASEHIVRLAAERATPHCLKHDRGTIIDRFEPWRLRPTSLLIRVA